MTVTGQCSGVKRGATACQMLTRPAPLKCFAGENYLVISSLPSLHISR
jgi:hypothetical protein